LIISPARLQAFRNAIEEAASSTAANLHQSGSFPWDLRVPRAALCRLSDFPEQAVFCGEEMMASVLIGHHGKPLGTSVISLEPRHAVELIRSLGVEGNPLDIFRTAGARVLQGMLRWFGTGGGSPIEFGNPVLEERSLVATVLGTHAPPDTMVISLEIGFVSVEQAFPAYLYLLLDAKVFQSTLGCLAEGEGGGRPGAPLD
jgi:hypothetical protein